MTEAPTVDRRADAPPGELIGAGLTALMALLFAVVVIFGKEMPAGPPVPDPGDPVRGYGRAAVLLVRRPAGRCCPGRAPPL